jgi:hypothetical protein
MLSAIALRNKIIRNKNESKRIIIITNHLKTPLNTTAKTSSISIYIRDENWFRDRMNREFRPTLLSNSHLPTALTPHHHHSYQLSLVICVLLHIWLFEF